MKDWGNYFALTGGSAVTLMGLLFVVITLAAESPLRDDDRLRQTFLTPTLIHLGVVFLIALLALSPEGDSLILPFGFVGVVCLGYSLRIALNAAREEGVFSDAWVFHGGIPIVCYVGIVAAAWIAETSTRQACWVLGAVSALLLLVGMRNGWAIAVDVAQRSPK